MEQRISIPVNRSIAFVDYIKLMKPELTLLSVLTAVGSAYLALHGSSQVRPLVDTFIGTSLVGGAAGVFNQYIERRFDASMKRTDRRPLPAGRIQPGDAFLFGLFLACSGILYLWTMANSVAGSLSILTLLTYLFIYTPLKRKVPRPKT